jgi:ABC-type uncharacterized transport system substrate-binding protein
MKYKKLTFTLIILCLQTLSFAYPQSIAIVASKNAPFAQDVIKQITKTVQKSLPDAAIDTIYTEDGDFISTLKNKQYNVICAFGTMATQISESLPNTPVIFTMAIENAKGAIATTLKTNSENFTGVYLSPEPSQQIDIIKKVLPNIKSITIFHYSHLIEANI